MTPPAESVAINPVAEETNAAAEKTWADHGGELVGCRRRKKPKC